MKKCLTFLVLFTAYFSLNSLVFGQNNQFYQQTKSIAQIVRAESFSDDNGTWIYWQTGIESGNLGFNIYRISEKETVRVNPNMIGGALISSTDEISYGREYSFFDTSGNSDVSYYIESLGINDRRKNSVEIKTQYISDLTKVAGYSSAFLQNAARTAQSDVLETELILPPELQSNSENDAPTSDSTIQKWIANQPGVKIGVRKKGLYRVSKTELENAGFNVNSDPNLWQLYLDGVEQSINIAPNGDYIEFYGRAIDTLLTNTNIYFLINGSQNGKRFENKVIRPFGGNVAAKSYNTSYKKAERLYYLNTQLNGEEENFYGTPINATVTNINFNLSAVEFNESDTNFTVSVVGHTLTPHLIDITLNGHSLGQMSWSNRSTKRQMFSIPFQFLQEGTNTLGINPLNGGGDIMFFESLKVDFPRGYAAEQNQLSFYTNNLKFPMLPDLRRQMSDYLTLHFPIIRGS